MASNSKQSSSYRSQKATAADLSLLEKLDTIPALLTVLTKTLLSLFTAPFRDREKTQSTVYRHVRLTAIRTIIERMSVRQQHYILPPTDDAYTQACKKRGFKPNSEILEDGTRAHWIGNSSAEKLVINFHGGGYVAPASPEMVDFMFQVVESMTRQGKNAACLFLSYDLAPGALYPRQLQQASMLLLHVLNNLNIKPGNIILCGDSAGANLCTQLLSHITHPHPSAALPIPRISLPSNQPLRGCVLVSPWVDFSTDTPAFIHNNDRDVISQPGGKKWSSAFMGCPWPHTSVADNYNQAAMAPVSWWEGLQVESVLVTAGADEVLVDGIERFVGKLKEGYGGKGGDVEWLKAEGEYHDFPNVDLQIGYKEEDEGVQAKKIKSWIGSKL